jgi:ABC-type sugar transport system, periplasmic component
MKKVISLMMAIALVVSFAGCGRSSSSSSQSSTVSGNPASSTASTKSSNSGTTNGKKVIGFTVLTTSDDFCNYVAQGIKKDLAAVNIDVQIASADSDVQKQISQVENFISMKVDGIIVISVEPTSMTDVLKRARKAGIKVLAFTNNPKEYDAFYGGDEALVGHGICQAAADWINKTFPDAPDQSIEVATLEYRNTPEAAARSEALHDIGKYTSKAKLVNSVETKMDQNEAMKTAENLLMTNPNLKAILCYNGTLAAGVNACAMAEGSRVKDLSKFGTFGSEVTDQIKNYIRQSVDNKSVLRATVNIGGISLDEIDQQVADIAAKMVNGEPFEKETYLQVFLVTPENVDAK